MKTADIWDGRRYVPMILGLDDRAWEFLVRLILPDFSKLKIRYGEAEGLPPSGYPIIACTVGHNIYFKNTLSGQDLIVRGGQDEV